MKSIKSKIFSIVLFSIICSSVIVGGFGIFWSSNAVRRDSAHILDLMAQSQTGDLNSMFTEVEQSALVLSEYVSGELDSLAALHDDESFSRYVAKLENIAYYIANCTTSALSISVRFAPELTDRVESFLWRRSGVDFVQDSLREFPVFGSDFDNSWYYKAKLLCRGVWTQPYYNEDLKEYVISYGIPVFKQGKFFAAVGVDIDFDNIAAVVNSISVYDSGHAFLTDEGFVIQYHRSIPMGTRILDQAKDFKQVFIKGYSAPFYDYTFKGTEFHMLYKNLENGMRLVVSVPAREIDWSRSELILMIVCSVLVIVVVVSILSVLMSNRLTRPLKELTDSTSHIVAGNYDLNFKHKPRDEIGELMGTFMLMAKSLKVQFDYINSLIYLDSMTGAQNKRAFIDERENINLQIKHSIEQNTEFAFGVIVFDVNNLKYLNDNFGHNAGDSLIKNSCKLITLHFEDSPVFRIGGDEFVVVITGKELENRVEFCSPNFAPRWTICKKTKPTLPSNFLSPRGLPCTSRVLTKIFRPCLNEPMKKCTRQKSR